MFKILMLIVMPNAAHYEYMPDSYATAELCEPVRQFQIAEALTAFPEAVNITGFCMNAADREVAEAIFAVPSGDK